MTDKKAKTVRGKSSDRFGMYWSDNCECFQEKSICLCVFSYFVIGCMVLCANTTMKFIAEEYSWSSSKGGMLISVMSIGALLLGVTGNLLVEKMGRKKAMVMYASFVPLSCGIIAVSPAQWSFFPLILVSGFAWGGINALTNTVVTEMYDGNPSRLNVMHAAYAVGAVLFPLLVGQITMMGGTWRIPMALAAVLGAALLVMCCLIRLPEGTIGSGAGKKAGAAKKNTAAENAGGDGAKCSMAQICGAAGSKVCEKCAEEARNSTVNEICGNAEGGTISEGCGKTENCSASAICGNGEGGTVSKVCGKTENCSASAICGNAENLRMMPGSIIKDNLSESAESPQDEGKGKMHFWHQKMFYVGMILFFCYVGTETAVNSWLASYLGRNNEFFSRIPAETMVSLMWLTMVIGRLFFAAVSSRMNKRVLLLGLSSGFLVGLAGVTLFAEYTGVVIVFVAFMGLAMSALYSTCVANCSRYITGSAAASGILYGMGNVGSACVPCIAGLISDAAGMKCALLSLCGVLVLMVAAALVNMREGRKA